MNRTDIERHLELLIGHAWEHEVSWPEIERWSSNFSGSSASSDVEKRHSLYALTRFVYFGKRMVREMLRSLYRDHFQVPLVQRIRRNSADTKDLNVINALYASELGSTRFIGVGNPSESGTHLLYYFRQINSLAKKLFVDVSAAFAPINTVGRTGGTSVEFGLRDPSVTRYIFFDDLVGSGSQASGYLGSMIESVKRNAPDVDIRFISLFATTHGLAHLNQPKYFNGNASALFELDNAYCAFDSESRYFNSAPPWFDKAVFKSLAETYGRTIEPAMHLGFGNGQLMLGFSHNTPDNTLPIFWSGGSAAAGWYPVFPRFVKIY